MSVQATHCFACNGIHYPSDVTHNRYFAPDGYRHKELPGVKFADRLSAHRAACEARQRKAIQHAPEPLIEQEPLFGD